jgi:COP9 signalosome complex subunit 5
MHRNRNEQKADSGSKSGKSSKQRNAHKIPIQDSIYTYDDKKIALLDKEAAWRKNPTYFKRCRINVLAATKMVQHSIQGVNQGRKKGGLPIEIMGLLVGRIDKETIIIMDCVELPVEGSETRVVADDEKVLGFMTRKQDRLEDTRKDRFIGWYHSHPFEVGIDSNSFFSAVDVSCQLMWQMQFGKWAGIVVDPLRCLAKSKVELLTFMCYPPNYEPAKGIGPDFATGTQATLSKRWGAAYNRYYQLQSSFFMGSLVRHNLQMMSRKHLWIRHLSSSSLMEPENREELPKRINTMNKMFNPNEMGRRSAGKSNSLQESMDMGRDIAIEQCLGHASQIVKNFAFNTSLSTAESNYDPNTPFLKKKSKKSSNSNSNSNNNSGNSNSNSNTNRK